MGLLVPHNFAVDIQDPVILSSLGYDFMKDDALSHKISIVLSNSAGELDLSEATADLCVNRSDGEAIHVSADIDGSTISGTLTADAFTVSGRIYILATVTIATATLTVLHKFATVKGATA